MKKLTKQELNGLKRGDVIIADLPAGTGAEKRGVRPCVVVSGQSINALSDNIIITPLTKAKNKKDEHNKLKLLDTQVLIKRHNYMFLSEDSIVQTEDIRSISKDRIGQIIGKLDATDILKIQNTVNYIVFEK